MKAPFRYICIAASMVFAISGCAAQSNSSIGKVASSELNKYGQIYTQMIQNELIWSDGLEGKICTLNIHLSEHCNVTEISSSGYEKLCENSEKAVKSVGVFPMPANEELAKKLMEIKLTIAL
ncbi:cell envelope integrity protein TolA [Vibrio cyclitrophicus]